MKKSMKKIISLSSLLFFTIINPVDALPITNSSFETGDLTGWTTVGNVFNEDSFLAQDGDRFAKLFQNFSGVPNFNFAFQDVSIQPGLSYTFNGYIRNGNGMGDFLAGSNQAFYKLEWFDISNSLISATEFGHIDSSTAQDDQWLLRTFTETSPLNAVTARLVLFHLVDQNVDFAGGSSSFDNISFQPTPQPTPEPATTLGFLALGTLGAATLKRKKKAE